MKDKRTPKNPGELRSLLSQVLIRHKRRWHSPVHKAHRSPHRGKALPIEQELYDQVTQFIKDAGRKAGLSVPLILPHHPSAGSVF